jgi:Cdc6-like AAA superfamily ATPase
MDYHEGGHDMRLKTSFNCLVAGAAGTGKTTFVRNLLSVGEQIFTTQPKKVFLFYSAMQNMYLEMEKEGLIHETIFVDKKTIPSLDDFYEMVHPYKEKGGSMIIFDDVMTLVNPDFEQLFCNLSHHENCSIIFLTQNLFYKDKSFRTMSLNSHYIVLMKNDRDKMQTSILGRQFSPGNSKFITDAYANATKKPYSYLLLDFKPDSPPHLRVRTNIFPHEFPIIAYLEK